MTITAVFDFLESLYITKEGYTEFRSRLAQLRCLAGMTQFDELCQLKDMRIDSRQIQCGDIFIAVPGFVTDGRKYIAQAIANGAAAVIAEAPARWPEVNLPFIEVPNLKDLLPALAAFYYGEPSERIKVIGITGTNGKTSTAHYIAQLLTAHHKTCGVMGTLGNGIPPNLIPAPLTTSDCCTVQQQLSAFAAQGAQFAVMEVASIALDQDRVLNTHFDTAVFTNLSQDHLDYHQDMEDYFAAKCKLFTDFAVKHCVINLDDPYAQRLLKLIPQNTRCITYSLHNQAADLYLDNILLQTNLIGKFNQSNVLAALACCLVQGFAMEDLLAAARNLQPVTGRMQQMNLGNTAQPMVIVDYAHTPDALVKALQTLREYQPHKLICIFGCGGDRDRLKRPLMTRAVMENSDEIIITNDNPRTEDPQQIVQDMLAGIDPGYCAISDGLAGMTEKINLAGMTEKINLAGMTEKINLVGMTETLSVELDRAKAIRQVGMTETLSVELDRAKAIRQVGMTETLSVELDRAKAIRQVGMTKTLSVELDRAKAIRQTIARAVANDIILIAGKGHEDYQIIGTTKLPFSDQEIAREALQFYSDAVKSDRHPGQDRAAVAVAGISDTNSGLNKYY